MESTDDNNNQLTFLYEFKELRKELLAVKKRIDQLEKSQEKQQERLDILERENHALKTQLNINCNKEGGSALKRKRTEKYQVHEKETESKPASADKKKTKTHNNNNNDDEEVVVISQYDNGDSFDSLSDDLLHKIVEFDGSCYSKFGLINKRCKNIYDVKEYKLTKETCLYGYGTIDMILQHYLKKRREGMLDDLARSRIVSAVIYYNRFDAIDWIIQLGDNGLLKMLRYYAACYGRVNVFSKLFIKSNLTMLDYLIQDDTSMCSNAALNGKLETLKWLRKYGAGWNAYTFHAARYNGHDEIVQYLRSEGCPESSEDTDESAVGSDNEDGDY